MATNKIYVDPGAIFAFMDPNGTTPPAGATRIAFALTNLAYLSGRISAPLDRGAGALPMRLTTPHRVVGSDAEGGGSQSSNPPDA